MGSSNPLVPETALAAAEMSAARPTRVRYQVLFAACTLAVVTYIHRVGFARALPELQKDLGLDDVHLSWLTATFLFSYGVFEMPAGLLGDKFGVRHLLTLLVLGWSLLTGCVALTIYLPHQWMLPLLVLLALRFAFGAFQAGGFPLIARMMTDWMPMQERGTAQGLIWMSSRVGGLIVPVFLGWLMLRMANWQTPLWIISGFGLLWCGMFWPWYRNRPEETRRVNAAERELIVSGRAPRSSGHLKMPWAKVLRSRGVWALCLMYGFGGFAANFYVTLLPTYLRNHRGLSDGVTSWLSGLPFACGLVACVGGGFLSDLIIRRTGNRKWGRRLNGTCGTLIGGIAWLFLNGVQDTWMLGFLLCLIFFCNDLAMGPAWAACADIGERYAGTLGGAMNMIGSFAGAAGNLLAGYLLQANHSGILFAVFAGSVWLGGLCWQGVDVTKPLDTSTD
ncbi:MAG TPA: MFS transporter [Gemmataceae bacterium]|nr:MFS transporter [Gemmataceae bacterium]